MEAWFRSARRIVLGQRGCDGTGHYRRMIGRLSRDRDASAAVIGAHYNEVHSHKLSAIVHSMSSLQLTEDPDRVRRSGATTKFIDPPSRHASVFAPA
jgi:hypothetical protein